MNTAERALEIHSERLNTLHVRVDRLFAGLLIYFFYSRHRSEFAPAR